MDSASKPELYSDSYKMDDFHWGISLGEGKYLRTSVCSKETGGSQQTLRDTHSLFILSGSGGWSNWTIERDVERS